MKGQKNVSKNQRILVTGAGGFIGHHLVRRLRAEGYWVRGADLKAPEYEATDANEFEILDLRQFENCLLSVRGGIDQVYNLAADMGGIGFITANHAEVARNNILINVHMLEASRLHDVKRFLFSSSACVYAQSKQQEADVTPLREEDAYPADPEPGYGWEKLYAEQLCAYYWQDYRFPTRIVRFHNVYGPLGTYEGGREKAPAAICRKVALARNHGAIEIWGGELRAAEMEVMDRGVKMRNSSRREFLKACVAATCSAGLSGSALAEVLAAAPTAPASGSKHFAPAAEHLTLKKGVVFDMLPGSLSYADRFKLARDVGLQVVQAPTTPDEHQAEEMKKAADGAGIRIDSVMNMDHWKYPLSSNDPAVVERSLAGMRTSLQNAKLWGSDTVLLVPAVLNPQTSYRDAWVRSQQQIRKLIPLAEEIKVVIAIEEVWNKFLLSPLEMATYVTEFQSPWIKVWFDVGNVMLYGYPQDWIRTLGKSIVKVHLKDFKRKEDGYAWVNLGDGDVDWAAVRQAFAEVGYSGSVIAELKGGDEAYLRDVSSRIDRLLLGS
jgi:L-ribulose-5-phosphate 3-epimerase